MSETGTSNARQVQRVLLTEAAANLFVFVAKLIVGTKTGSAAILADAIHSATDLVNNGFALVAARISGTPPDREHPYGHHKFETLAIFGLAILLVVVAIEIALRAVDRIGTPIEHSGWGLIVMLGVLATTLAISAWETYWARRLNSHLLRADAWHTLSDSLTTIVVIIGWQLAARGYPWLDPLFALLIAGLVFYLAFGLFREAVPILVDEVASDPLQIIENIRTIPGVREVRKVRSRSTGTRVFADVVVAVDGQLSTDESHEIANKIEDVLSSKLGIGDVAVHIEPV